MKVSCWCPSHLFTSSCSDIYNSTYTFLVRFKAAGFTKNLSDTELQLDKKIQRHSYLCCFTCLLFLKYTQFRFSFSLFNIFDIIVKIGGGFLYAKVYIVQHSFSTNCFIIVLFVFRRTPVN